MTHHYRSNLLLLLICIACAIGVVASQHRARQLHYEIEKQNTLIHQLDVEYGRLQLEQSTQAMHARIEQLAKSHLGMVTPIPQRTVVLQANPNEQETSR